MSSCVRHPGSDCFPGHILTREQLLDLRKRITRDDPPFGVVPGSDFDPIECWTWTVDRLIDSHLAALEMAE